MKDEFPFDYSASDLAVSRDHGLRTEDESLEWAREEYRRGLQKLLRVAPVPTLDGLRPGEIIISRTGNTRLVVHVEPYGSDQLVTFITRLRGGEVRVESAPKRQIDVSRLAALVVRRSGNPLERFLAIMENIRNERVVMNNIRVLLLHGALGGQIRSRLSRTQDSSGYFQTVELAISPETGQIEEVGRVHSGDSLTTVRLMFNKVGAPSEDYIKSAAFFGETPNVIKRNILVSCVVANTIENARNLLGVALMAGE